MTDIYLTISLSTHNGHDIPQFGEANAHLLP